LAAARIDRKPETSLRIGVRTLGKLSASFLKGGERHPTPLSEKGQVRIATERFLMAELAQEVTQSRMILQIPRRQVR